MQGVRRTRRKFSLGSLWLAWGRLCYTLEEPLPRLILDDYFNPAILLSTGRIITAVRIGILGNRIALAKAFGHNALGIHTRGFECRRDLLGATLSALLQSRPLKDFFLFRCKDCTGLWC